MEHVYPVSFCLNSYSLSPKLRSTYAKRRGQIIFNKMPKVVSVGCVGLGKHNGVLSEFGKITETGKMCHVMSIDE